MAKLPTKEERDTVAASVPSATELLRVAGAAATAQRVAAANGVTPSPFTSLFSSESAEVRRAVDDYASSSVPSQVKQYIEREGNKLRDSFFNFDKKLQDKEEQVEHIERSIVDLNSRYQRFEDLTNDWEGQLAGFKASIVEALKLEAARKLWGGRAKSAFWAFWLSALMLVILLIAVPVFGILESDTIFAFFRKIGQAVVTDLPATATDNAILVTAVSRLVLITLPVALYVWLIRIVVRFNMRSLLLMDDAEQRKTMLETYLHLVEQDATVKADRPLILEALFRRTPGHGNDSIEPPNLADVMKLSGQIKQ